MFSRLIAFVLIAVLLWAGFDTAELPRASIASQESVSVDAKTENAVPAPGADIQVETPADSSRKVPAEKSNFPLDAQAQLESWNEQLGAPPVQQASRAAQQHPDTRPQRIEESAHLAPCLDGLLRPPCVGRFAA